MARHLARVDLTDRILQHFKHFAGFAPKQQEVISQGRIYPAHGEIPASQIVLKELDLHGKVVVGDALHAQRDLAVQMVTAGADYDWTIKENQLG